MPMYVSEVVFFYTSHTQLHGYREGAGKRLSFALLVLPAAFSKVSWVKAVAGAAGFITCMSFMHDRFVSAGSQHRMRQRITSTACSNAPP